MSNSSRCNGLDECGDGSDEDGCGKYRLGLGGGKSIITIDNLNYHVDTC